MIAATWGGNVMNKSMQIVCHDLQSYHIATKPRTLLCGVAAASIACFSNLAGAHDITLGSESTLDFLCDATANWDTARSVVLGSFPHAHNCVIIASVELNNPGGNTADQLYHISVSMDNVNPPLDNSAARTVELRGQAHVNDPSRWPVSTTSRVVAGANASHIFRLLCRKNSFGNPNLLIVDSGINIVCDQQ
jgi:hypothetical protein